MKLSEQIKKYRKDNNMTQTDFANKLYVSKQAISKWENDLGLPDVSLYPVLSEILNVSIDELMGKKKKSNSNKKIIIILGISTIVLFVSLFIILNKYDYKKTKHIKDTESYLNIKLPKIKEYEFVDYYDWISFNNYQLPQDMYYFIFKNEVFKIDDTWVTEFNEEIENILPELAFSYLSKCDLFKLVNKDTSEINTLPLNDKDHTRLVLYCIQIEVKRLIVINFEV